MEREEMMEFEDVISDRKKIYSNLENSYVFSKQALEQAPITEVADLWENAEEKTEFYIRLLSTEKISGDVKRYSDLADLGFFVLDSFYRNAENYLEAEESFDIFADRKGKEYDSLSEEMEDRRGEDYDFTESTEELLDSIEELDEAYWKNWGIEILGGWN